MIHALVLARTIYKSIPLEPLPPPTAMAIAEDEEDAEDEYEDDGDLDDESENEPAPEDPDEGDFEEHEPDVGDYREGVRHDWIQSLATRAIEAGYVAAAELGEPVQAWALVSAALEHDHGQVVPACLREALDQAIELGLVQRDSIERRAPITQDVSLNFGESEAARADYAAILHAGDVQAVRGIAVAWPAWLVREALLEASETAVGCWSFDRHVVPLRSELLHYAAKLAGGNRAVAEDVVQDAFTCALRAWPRWRPSSGRPSKDARSWMFRIVCNTYMKRYRDDGTRKRYHSDRWEDMAKGAHGGDIVDGPLDAERRGTTRTMVQSPAEHDSPFGDEVEAAIAQLPPEQQQVIREYFAGGGTSAEVALRIGSPKNTVHTRRARALAGLRQKLAGFAKREYGIGDGEEGQQEADKDGRELAYA